MTDIYFYKLFDADRFEEVCKEALQIYVKRELDIKNQVFTATIGTDGRKDVYIEFDKGKKLLIGQVKFFQHSDQYDNSAIKTKIKKTIGGDFNWDGNIPKKSSVELTSLEVYKFKEVKYLYFFFSCDINEAAKMQMEVFIKTHYKTKLGKDLQIKIFDKNQIIQIIHDNDLDKFSTLFNQKVIESSLGDIPQNGIPINTKYAEALKRLGYSEIQVQLLLSNNIYFERYYDKYLSPNNLKKLPEILEDIQTDALYNFNMCTESGMNRHKEVTKQKIGYYQERFSRNTLEDRVTSGTYGNMSDENSKFTERIEW